MNGRLLYSGHGPRRLHVFLLVILSIGSVFSSVGRTGTVLNPAMGSKNETTISSTTVTVDPPAIAGLSNTSGNLTVSVNLRGAPSIDSFLVSLEYNDTVLHALSLNFTDNVLGNNAYVVDDCVDGRPFQNGCEIWDGPGVVSLGLVLFGNHTTPNPTDGLLFHLTLKIVGKGFSPFHLFHMFLTNGVTNEQVPLNTVDGYFTNNDCPVGSGNLCKPLTVAFTWSPSILVKGTVATFTGSAVDPNPGGTASLYLWSWGDSSPGQASRMNTIDHVYYSSGNYTIVFGITDSYGVSAFTNVIVPIIPHFSLHANPLTLNAFPGRTVISTITIATLGSGFTGLVTLGLTEYPMNAKGFEASILPSSLTLDSVNASANATLIVSARISGTYSVVVNASATGVESQTINVNVQVVDFEITAFPGMANAGQSATSTITIRPEYGLAGAVSLSYPNVPAGLSCGPITPDRVQGPNSASLSCSSTLASDYRVTVYGTDGVSSHNATASFIFIGGNQIVNSTWVLDSGKLVAGNYSPANGPLKIPTSLAYDSKDDRIFVTNGYSRVTDLSANVISVIDARTNMLLTSIPVGNPRGIAYDPVNDKIYVANPSSLTVIDGLTETVVANVPAGWGTSVAFDSQSNEIFVAQSGMIAVINATTDALIASVKVSDVPTSLVYDAFNNYVYLDSARSGTVSIISGLTDSLVGNVTSSHPLSVLGSIQSMAYDSNNHNVYVLGSGVVSVISGLAVIGNITIELGTLTSCIQFPCEPQITFDPSNGNLYVTSGSSFASGNVTIIDPSSSSVTARVLAGIGPTGIAYDSSSGNMYIADSGSESLSAISSQTGAIVASIAVEAYPSDLAYDSTNGVIYVSNSGNYARDALVKAAFSQILFGLNSTGEAVKVLTTGGIDPSGIVYDPFSNEVFVAEQLSNTVSAINATSGSLIAVIPVGLVPSGLVYVPTNHDIYVANSYMDDLTVIDGTLNKIVANMTAGRYPFGLTYDSQSNDIFVSHASPFCGCSNYSFITVVSASTNSVVANYTVGKLPLGIMYDPSNNEVYVADPMANSVWAVNGTTDAIVADIPVAEFQAGLVYDPLHNEIFVTDGSPLFQYSITADVVSVINATSNTVVGNIEVGFGPSGGAFDPACGCVYIANYYSGTVSQIITPEKTPSSLSLSCPQGSLNVGTFTTCQVTVTGRLPSGEVTFSSDSASGAFTPTTGVCVLSTTERCSVTYTDTSTSNTTAIISARYSGDAYNTGATGTFSITIVKPSDLLVSATSAVTISSGSATADQTLTTGISVEITGSTATNGTLAAINTQDLSGPSTGVGTVSLSGAKYYDVEVNGIDSGTAKVCINYSATTSSTRMQYWTGQIWASATGVTTTGTIVCGQIPVSALTGTNIAVGNTASSASSSDDTWFVITTGVLAAGGFVAITMIFLRRRRVGHGLTVP